MGGETLRPSIGATLATRRVNTSGTLFFLFLRWLCYRCLGGLFLRRLSCRLFLSAPTFFLLVELQSLSLLLFRLVQLIARMGIFSLILHEEHVLDESGTLQVIGDEAGEDEASHVQSTTDASSLNQ